MKYYCPDCVEPLIKDRKKLAGIIIWIICPKCGFRTRETHLDTQESNEEEYLSERIKADNKSGGLRGDHYKENIQ